MFVEVVDPLQGAFRHRLVQGLRRRTMEDAKIMKVVLLVQGLVHLGLQAEVEKEDAGSSPVLLLVHLVHLLVGENVSISSLLPLARAMMDQRTDSEERKEEERDPGLCRQDRR